MHPGLGALFYESSWRRIRGMTTGLGNMTYEERLREQDLFSLAKRWGM